MHRPTRGATSIEYALIAALIAIAALAAVMLVGDQLKLRFLVLANVVRDQDVTEPGAELYAAVWPYAHGGDGLLDETEFNYIQQILDPRYDSYEEDEFDEADQNSDESVDYDEWMDFADVYD